VIGMAGQFPKAASIEQFWDNIAQGRDCISEVPRERWDNDAYFREGEPQPGKTNSRWMGALDEYDRFDPLFFSLSPVEAQSMDPQQRLFLQACWHCIEHAGYDARALSGSRCGVFVGCAPGDYLELAPGQRLTAQSFTGGANSILAARISYLLNLQGPCLSIDTACSSSLVAIAQACDSLLTGESDAVLTGGVAVMATPEMHIRAAQAGMLSPTGRCFTFDQRANGFVPAEGVGVVMLKRLADALRDHDTIHGLIHGWGVNQDGKTNGITAPNPESQTRLQQHVYEKYRIDPAGIQLIEAHGTGTRLGDPIEVEGLCGSFGKYTDKRSFCALGSVKSNIGHCMAAAGVAGLIKVVMALKNQKLPPTIHFERLNEHIPLAGKPFYVNDRLKDWSLDGADTRRAAVSSFGFSGTNAHVVLGEYLPPARVQAPAGVSTGKSDILVPLSARTVEQLDQKVRDLLDWIHIQPDLDLPEMAYTLQVGREAMEERLGFVVTSIGQVTQKLQAYAAGTRDMEGMYRGQVTRGKERVALLKQDADLAETVIGKYIADGKPAKLLELWVNGLDVGWNRLYGEVKPQRIALPLYPFAKERCWIEPVESGHAVVGSMTTAALHPLLHTNTSDFSAQSYTSVFRGEESFLADHRIHTSGGTAQSVLPGVAYLEMARAALELAIPDRPTATERSAKESPAGATERSAKESPVGATERSAKESPVGTTERSAKESPAGTRESPARATVLELRDIVWLQPLVVTAPTEVSITLSAAEADELALDEFVYEIHSQAGGQRMTHCRGRAVFVTPPPSERIDVAALQAQMTLSGLDSGSLYDMFARMGLEYGPAHRGVQALHQGEGRVLATLRLPAAVAQTRRNYVLHPSLLDSALQASIGLSLDPEHHPSRPPLPFSLESLRILSACEEDMFAYVRRSPGSRPADAPAVDIDLCDRQGRICVQIRGFSSRILAGREEPSAFDSDAYRQLIEKVLSKEISVEAAVEFG
jgi:acyl transferase domain-containing protein